MAALAEDSVDGRASNARRLRNALLALFGAGVVVGGGMWLKDQFAAPSAPARKVARIMIMPDRPPPPPPPPKEEKRPEPPKEQKQMKVEQPKPVEAPPQQAEQLKMEGAAGDGPSPFAAGAVTNEYKGGEVATIGGGPARPNRMQFAFFTSALQRHIQDELARNREVKQINYRVTVKVWLARDGAIRRAELAESTGDDAADAALSAALREMRAFRDAPPADMPQPVRLRITNRMTG
jgi:periplasmic protein TonB